ncbi:MAG: hypothetical protein HYV93_06700 [Candidatus Rokubacteria bacterium]|nr:hypothetical protein [Candidatus Rokubacteria bacterium]
MDTLAPGVGSDVQRPRQILVVADSLQLVLALEGADRKAEPHSPDAQGHGLIDVARHRTAQDADLRPQAEPAHFGDCVSVFVAAGRSARLDLVDAKVVQGPRDPDLGGPVQDHARLLFSIPERAVG